MNKKNAIVFIIIVCSIGLAVMLNYDTFNEGSGNLSVEQIITKAIKIQYSEGNDKEINIIFTEDFIKQIDKNPQFYKREIFYTIDKDYMMSFKELNETYAKVSVRVEDLSGSYIQIFTLIKNSDGIYQISNIEFDI